MINFFKKIRKGFLTTGRTTKYLTYAMGEIILVVIGILIALSINNWNGEKFDHKKEINYLKSLKNEMESNLQYVHTEEKRILDFMKREEVLAKIMSSPKAIDSTSDKTIFKFYYDIYNNDVITNIETGAISEIISSGGLQYIKNESIRKLIASWDTKTFLVKYQEENLKETSKEIDNLFFDEEVISTRYIYSFLESFDTQKLGEPLGANSLKPLLQSKKFESLCLLHYGKSRVMIVRTYPKYKASLNQMIDLINSELDK
jgi:DNA-directed RNA polymerase beta subunit